MGECAQGNTGTFTKVLQLRQERGTNVMVAPTILEYSQRKSIVERYAKGERSIDLQQEFGIGSVKFDNVLQEFGVQKRKHGQQYPLPERGKFEEDCKRMRWHELEKEYGVSWSIIKYWKRQYGLTDGKSHVREVITRAMANGCLACSSHKKGKGYPRMKGVLVAKAEWVKHYGQWPKGMLMRHLCANKWCVNHEHVVPGTSFENLMDVLLDGKGKSEEAYVRTILNKAITKGLIIKKGEFFERTVDGKVFKVDRYSEEFRIFERLPASMNEGGGERL